MRSPYFMLSAPVLALLLVGCQSTKPIAMSVNATPTASGIKNGDMLAPQRTSGQDIPQLRGQEMVTIRTYENIKKPDVQFATLTEIEGVTCEIESDGYKATVKTPAEVRVPNYGYASRLISARCNAPGYKPGFESVKAYNKTGEQRMNSASGGGLAGVVLVAMIHAATDEKKHEFAYPPLKVTMTKPAVASAKQVARK